jgi:hypothetical protein
MWQHQSGDWVQLGSAAFVYGVAPDPLPRGVWRFDRDSGDWQVFDEESTQWGAHTLELRATDEPAVSLAFWSGSVAADMGQWDGETFTSDVDVDPADILFRYKPFEDVIVDAGIPAIPALPVGASIWRYLSREPESVPTPTDLPAWTIEGRLIPPPQIDDAPGPGRFSIETPPPPSYYDEAVFAFNPSAKVWLSWEPKQPLSVLVRLKTRTVGESIDPAVLDRVWQGIQQVRPAGVRAMLAVDEEIVRGK